MGFSVVVVVVMCLFYWQGNVVLQVEADFLPLVSGSSKKMPVFWMVGYSSVPSLRLLPGSGPPQIWPPNSSSQVLVSWAVS